MIGSIGFYSPPKIVKADSTSVTDADINTYISNMTLDQKIGQMFVVRTSQDTDKARADIAKYNLGGLIVYGVDFTSVGGTTAKEAQNNFKTKMQSFQSSASLPLLIGVDQEGGTVSRLSQNPLIANGRSFPSPQTSYANGGMANVTKEASEVGTILKNLGINWNYAPVADSTSDTSSFIYGRTFGQDYLATANYITNVIPAWQNAGVAATLKHFPGYGSAIDTHTDFAVVTKSKEDFEKEDLLPFKSGITAGADSVMIAHIVMQAVDPVYPASLSRKVVTDLLRNDLGYNGLIITDALEMGAIKQFAQEHDQVPVDVLAVEAGNDCIMNNDYETAIPQIHAAVSNGTIKESEINEHVFRILDLKRKLGLLAKAQLQQKKVQIDNVSYSSDNKKATVSGTVVDSDWQIGEPLSVKDSTGKVIITADVGAGGKFNFDVPTTAQEQVLTLTTNLPNIADAQITIKAVSSSNTNKALLENLINYAEQLDSSQYTVKSWQELQTKLTESKSILNKDSATQDQVDVSVNSLQGALKQLVPISNSGNDGQNSNDSSSQSSSNSSGKEPSSNSNANDTNVSSMAQSGKNSDIRSKGHNLLPSTGERVMAGISALGIILIACVTVLYIRKKGRSF
ncbi:LPXTG cell wall anchor domain-containing protein [Lacticaseibacillus paracasei]|uniref:glycoside hydrolase family 3 protein n=1 Tax=Lacticaseibacillus paracasei TaxID=1597 RepID=UPI00102252CE|nr:glycoside hydrolase family 3 N-terminal domain-containing protein [Lacticaseibacillus paracasei]MBX4167035.1 LPXTG cell wall anchor domain-containing protein [Lacticaseibacillus paracasei]MSC31472.1 LPXTG cell wall anchor domain-containing protein [Lacticaseibacillus paracasei]MSC37838.1 LPXTG cell wall anchor domain-containing protein [Lacticaseibacillus paracasei]MSC44213.1 LPXTG cell wall anchor domain-containing protein [Lacticaseibacillus paracasei]RYS94712.1 LPXTG cell wall anchor dom